MQEKEIEPILDFCTRMQIQEIMTASYTHPPLKYENKLAIWRAIPIKKLGAGMDYYNLIKEGRA
jgi:hypothetical protein